MLHDSINFSLEFPERPATPPLDSSTSSMPPLEPIPPLESSKANEPTELDTNFKPSTAFEPSFESMDSTPTSPDFHGFNYTNSLASTQTPDYSSVEATNSLASTKTPDSSSVEAPNASTSSYQHKSRSKRTRKKGQITVKSKRLRED